MERKTFERRTNVQIKELMIKKLQLFPHTKHELTSSLKMHHKVVQDYLDELIGLGIIIQFVQNERTYYRLTG